MENKVVPRETPAGDHEDELPEFAQGIPNKSIFEIEPENENLSPIEQVNLTVPITDDPTIPVWTFRMWFLGLLICAVLSFLNQFFYYRTEPLIVSALVGQIAAMPMGQFMAATLPTTVFFKGSRFAFSLNPGPFNMKEHVLITIFANSGSGTVYATGIVDIVKALYLRNISFVAGLLVCVTTQMLGYGWAGLFRDFLVKPGVMWWPQTLVQVSLFRTLHEPDVRRKGGVTRFQFFIIAIFCSFAWYILPGYLFPMLTSMSWVCWAWPNSILAHQLGSGLHGLGIGAFTLDWSAISSGYLLSPLGTPWFAIANIGVGFAFVMYFLTPIFYWTNTYNAKTFPIFSSHLFTAQGEIYDINQVISNTTFELDINKYNNYGKVHISTFFAMTYGVGFAALTATISHVGIFYGKDIWRTLTRALKGGKDDVHTRLMKAYPEVPQWWFHAILLSMIALSIGAVEGFKTQLQLPWWGVLFACALAVFFTLPIGVIAATTNQVPGLNIITEYIMGYVYPGRPVANVCFKTFGYISMTQAVTFLQDFKLGHYLKIPPKAMFAAQIVGTVEAAVVYLGTAWWLLTTIKNICNTEVLPSDSPWTCPEDHVFFDASVIWGLVGPKRIFGSQGIYKQINWWFGIGALAPIPVWIATKIWPKVGWIRAINMPILIGATGVMPPATSINFTMWVLVGFIFNYVIFHRRKAWWTRYNYVLSASLDAGLAFMGVAIYFALQLENKGITWWGENLDNCPLATCPTQPGALSSYSACPTT
ncbi:unnamed protein product [Calypogeia fissa]